MEGILVVAQASPSQPGDSTAVPPPAVPQPSATQPPTLPQPLPIPPEMGTAPSPVAPQPSEPQPLLTPQVSPATPPPATSAQPQSLPSRPFPSRRLQPPASVGSQGSTPPSRGEPSPTVAPPTPPSASAPPSAPARPLASQAGAGVVFNFDNADIYEVIRVMGEILRINYIIDPRVKGAVNIHTSGQISSTDVLPIFQSILRLNGATAVKRDGVYEIVPLPEAKKLPASPSSLQDSGKGAFEERYVIQILPLKYIPATEVSKMIKPFLSDGADIVEHPASNILIIGDLASNVKKSVDIISLFDVDIFTDLRVRVYPILNADVAEVAKEMEKIFSSFEVSVKSGRGVGITFTPIARINSLLVVSSIPNIFEKVEGWLKELDRIPGQGSRLSVFVYYCQNAKAKDLAEVLKQVFTKGKETKTEKGAATTSSSEAFRGPRPAQAPTAPAAPGAEEAAGVPLGEIGIVVDETTNSLIIKAFQRDYRAILETIKKLDIYPKQVLIEVFLAEITLDESNKFGIEWANFFTNNTPNPAHTQGAVLGAQPPTDSTGAFINPFNASFTSAGIRYAIVELGGRLSAAVNLAASQDRLKVISSPHIIASNNKEAKIQVGSSQPILTNTYTTPGVTSTTGSGVVSGTIEYKDIGIILAVTPRISDGGLVSLEINVENSTVNTSAIPLGNLSNVPVFGKKTAKTVLSVMEGQTVVIGGLISDSKEKVATGVPLLSKIPILGALFGFQTYEKKRDELILLMTPHVIADQMQADEVTKEFKEKVEGMKKQLEEKEKKEQERKEKK